MGKRRYLLLAWIVLLLAMTLLRHIELAPADHRQPPPTPDITLVDGLARPVTPPPSGLIESAAGLGFLLIGAWLTGRIFRRLGLPMITGYLVFGVLVGPQLHQALAPCAWFAWLVPAALVPAESLQYLTLVNNLAISIIAFTAGGEIRLESLRTGAKHIVSITLAGVLLIFLGVAAVLYLARPLVPLLAHREPAVAIVICMVLATIAIANSPATALAVIKEADAHGPTARIGLAVTVCKDLALVIVFTVLMAVALRLVPGDEAAVEAAGPSRLIGRLAWQLLASIVIGALAGGLFRLAIGRVAEHMAIFVIGAGFGLALLSKALDPPLEPLLVALSAGFVLANLWPRQSARMFHATEELSMPVYCVFFAVAGATIRIDALIQLWPLALFIVAVRALLLWVSTFAGAAITRLPPPARTWMWTTFIAQAGVSIALVTQVTGSFRNHPWGAQLASLLLAVIAIHQLIGPPLMRLGLIRAGEVPRDENPP